MVIIQLDIFLHKSGRYSWSSLVLLACSTDFRGIWSLGSQWRPQSLPQFLNHHFGFCLMGICSPENFT